MATFYIQLQDKLLQISGELTVENISKALGYVPVSPNVTNELSQRVDNITFDSLKDNPFLQDGSGELNIVDESGNIIAKINADGIHSVDFIAGEHRLSNKANKSELSNYATKDEVSDLVDMSVVTELQGKVDTLVGEDSDKSVRDIAVDVLTETLVSETATEAYDTLAEMSAWIKSHPEDASAMNTAIQKNATDIQSNATAISNLDTAYKAADSKVLTDAQEYADNINFYTIKDNPIVDGEAGSITFVDETGYIGLKVTEDGIVAKDVVTPEHTLSSKADKSFVEDNYYNKSTVDKKITEAVTGGQVSLDGFATEQWVNEQGFLKEHQDISHLAEKSELPTNTSDLTNDSGFITIDDVPEVTVPTKVSELENDKGYLTEHQDISHLATKAELPTVPTKVSELENDSKFITIDEVPEVTVPSKTSDLTNDSGFITLADVPVQEIPEEYVTETELNDKGFLTEHQDISHLASKEWVNNKNYATEYDLKTIDYSTINNVPVSEDETGELTIADENGNIGMKVASEAVYAKDFIAGEHKLSEKQGIISDIEDIRSGAAKGATAVQPSKLALVATSGDYNDLSNKPTIPTKLSDLRNGNILTCEFMGEVGDVICSEDDTDRVARIHEWVEALSMGKVCVLDFDDYEGTYAMVHALNYRSHATFGLGISRFSYVFEGYLYEVEYDEVVLPVTITIVNKTKIGSTSEGGSSAYTEVNHGTSDSAFELTPNTFHVWDEVASLDLSLGAETSGVANEYLFQFTSGSTPTTLTLPDDIKFSEDLTIEANKIYQISILKGLGSVLSWEPDMPIVYFTIGSQEFQAKQGMTWLEWINSEYNTDGYKSDSDGRVISRPGTDYIYNVTINDNIIPNNNYTTQPTGTSGGGD